MPDETDAVVYVSLRFIGDGGSEYVDADTLESRTVVEAGDTVTWVWLDDYCHSVTSQSGPVAFTTWGGETEFGYEPELVRPDGIARGEARTFSFTFEEPGTYAYVCVHHQTLGTQGEVVVTGESDQGPGTGDPPGHDDDRERGNPEKELGRSEDAPGHDDDHERGKSPEVRPHS